MDSASRDSSSTATVSITSNGVARARSTSVPVDQPSPARATHQRYQSAVSREPSMGSMVESEMRVGRSFDVQRNGTRCPEKGKTSQSKLYFIVT